MKKILIVSHYTFNEAVKSKLLLNIVFLGIALLLTSYVASELAYGSPEKIALDIGIGLTSLAVKFIAIFYGVNIIQSEIENRSIYLILSRPISKVEYFLGRTLGMSSMLFLNVMILGPFSIALFLIMGGAIDSLMAWALIFIFIESLLLLLTVVTCSLFCSKVLAILLGVSAYVGGYVSAALLDSNQFAQAPVFNTILKIVNISLPNFSRLNLKDYLIYQQGIELNTLFATLGHSLCFIIALMIMGAVLIHRKSLD
ncbi:MAG: hypothetical protein CME71_05660 [Halobacteriovorax sp.]|nr:hypothetical protein [Halobacteriovorax sp.]